MDKINRYNEEMKRKKHRRSIYLLNAQKTTWMNKVNGDGQEKIIKTQGRTIWLPKAQKTSMQVCNDKRQTTKDLVNLSEQVAWEEFGRKKLFC